MEDDSEKVALLGPRYSDKQMRAFERRGFYLGIALFQSVWISGTIYGWPAFLLMLRAEHVYSNRCGTDEHIEHPGHNATMPVAVVEVRFIYYLYIIYLSLLVHAKQCAEQEILFNRCAVVFISF
jgi:hypothetical protein